MSNELASEMTISTQHPALAGHFPNQPIVPAALLLDQLLNRWEQLAPVEPALPLSLQQVRFTAPVQPGTPVQLLWQRRDAASWRVSARQGDREVCRGLIHYGEPDSIPMLENSASTTSLGSAGDCYQQLPHAGSMCLIEQIACCGDDSVGYAVLRPDNPLISDQRFSAWLALEYAAQLFACRGVREIGRLSRAQVVMVRRIHCHQPAIVANQQTLGIYLRLSSSQPNASSCLFSVSVGNCPIASGEFTAVFN